MNPKNATEILLQRDPNKGIKPVNNVSTRYQKFTHSDLQDIGDPSGIAIQEGEFIYGLVRIILPQKILETGTNIGVSTTYMALAMQHNGFGTIDTIEHNATVAQRAANKFIEMGLSQHIVIHNKKIEDFQPEGPYDMLWLDSELALRYGELLRFYDLVKPGGIIGIHDLWEMDYHEFGGVPEPMKVMLRDGRLRGMTFNTDHGVTVFQKRREKDHLADIQSNKI